MKSFLYARQSSKLEGKNKTSYRLQLWCSGPWDLEKPDLGEFLVTPSQQVLKCSPLWRRWVHNLFLSLLCWQVQTPSWIAPPSPRGESQLRLTALGKTGTSCQRQPASRHPGCNYSDPKYQQTVDPSVCFVESLEVLCTDFLGDLCYIPEMQILPLALNKCIHAVFMVRLNRAVSLPGLPCLVPLGVGWGLCDSPHFHVSVRSGYHYCFVIIAV